MRTTKWKIKFLAAWKDRHFCLKSIQNNIYMITIESRHIMDEIRKTCPVQITGSLDKITILPPKSWDKICGVIRFETSDGDQNVDAHWYINVMPEITELIIRYPVCGEIISVEL